MTMLIVYSSRTGNTKKIAEAIAAVMPEAKLASIDTAPAPDDFDWVALGFWVNKGLPDNAMLRYMQTIRKSTVALFGTLGAWPNSEHAKKCIQRSEALLAAPEAGNTVLGTFLCQGRVDPAVISLMQQQASPAHPMTEERKQRLLEAAKHPDEQDCRRAQEVFLRFAAQRNEHKPTA
jgi:flavodoxin